MRRASVVCVLLVFSMCVTGTARSFSGLAYSALWLDLSGSDVNMATDGGSQGFFGVIDVEYGTYGLTFGGTAILSAGVGLRTLLFDAAGWLGAIHVSSFLHISAAYERFEQWSNFAWLTISNVDFYALLELQNVGVDPFAIGLGCALGAQTNLGLSSIAIEAQFNLERPVQYRPIGLAGLGGLSSFPYVFESYRWETRGWSCLKFEPGTNFFQGWLSCGGESWERPWPNDVAEAECGPGFSGLDILANLPLACLDLWAHVQFTCDLGFSFLEVEAYDIELLSWLELDFLEIRFTTQEKSLSYDFDLVLLDRVCIDPIFELVLDGTELDGIILRGLTTAYEISPGVLLKAGTIFQPEDPGELSGNHYYFDPRGNPWPWMGNPDVEPDLICPPACSWWRGEWYVQYDEYVAIIVDGDSCCGGGFMVSIFNWFDIGDDNPYGDAAGILDWEETVVDLSVEIGSTLTLVGGFSVYNEDLNYMKIGFQVLF
jgi:hypothetical protein